MPILVSQPAPPSCARGVIRRVAGMEKMAKRANLPADLASNGCILRIAANLARIGGIITPLKSFICRNPFDVIDLVLALCRSHE